MTPRELRAYLDMRAHPVLCIGPMSRACVDAVVMHADAIRRPIPLIASRRQIEAASLGGGYVENWTTAEFAAYARSIGGRYTLLCRDHGGPWQGSDEEGMDVGEAMDRAKQSIAEDIEQGFGLIHLDPSVGEETRTVDETLDLLFDLYAYTLSTARALGREVEIEIGTEQQSGEVAGPESLIAFLKSVSQFCREGNHQAPLFCVVQTGTLVREMRNVGLTEGRKNEEFDQRYAVQTMERNVRSLADVAYINGVHVKEHNGDYLSDGSMATRRDWELGGVNIAPELGVTETRTLLSICSELGLKRERDAMLRIFYESGKWRKWMRSETGADDLDRAVIAGHYSFANPEFVEIRSRVEREARSRGVDLESCVRLSLTASLRRMLWCLGYHSTTEPSTSEQDTAPAMSVGASEGIAMTSIEPKPAPDSRQGEHLGGNVVRRIGGIGAGAHEVIPLASGAYAYDIVELRPGSRLQRTDLRSVALWVLSGAVGIETSGGVVTVNEDQAALVDSDCLALSNLDRGAPAVVLVAGVGESPGGAGASQLRVLGREDLKRVEKPWGEEIWINGRHPGFAFKRIVLKSGFRTSLQYHEHKRETNLLVSGRAILHYARDTGALTGPTLGEPLSPVSVVDVTPGVLHRIEAVTDVTLFEVSTPHLDDVIRVSDDANRPDGLIASEHAGARVSGAA